LFVIANSGSIKKRAIAGEKLEKSLAIQQQLQGSV